MTRLIDRALLDEVSGEARHSQRRRMNRNFHQSNDYPAHRLLNAVEPDSYIAPHRHLDPAKDETLVVLRGKLGLVIFDDAGNVLSKKLLIAGGECIGVDIPHGTWHTLLSLEAGSVFLEAKAGPYLPPADIERASWAPAENDANTAEYHARLAQLFA